MMTKEQLLLLQLEEECLEVAQRCSKAIRFGINERQEGQDYTNKERILAEMDDLYAVIALCIENKLIPDEVPPDWEERMELKKQKVLKYLAYSQQLGQVEDNRS